MALRTTTSLALVLFASACAYQPTPASDTFVFKTSAIKQLQKRAEFDLNCDAQELAYKELGNTSVGVTGCGNRVRYEFVSGVGWVADIASEDRTK